MSEPIDVGIIGGGVAGLSASIFTARHGLDTVVFDTGNSVLRRNAHLENYPGFPAGIDARLLLDSMEAQSEKAGAVFEEARVTDLETDVDGFRIVTSDGSSWRAENVIAATKNETGYLVEMDGVEILDRGKTFVDVDERGRTGVPGLYAAGRIAMKPHQAIVAAGHGSEVAVTLLEDIETPFYHDWVAPKGYFGGRGREVPPGVEELEASERQERDASARARLEEMAAEPHPGAPEQHPAVGSGDGSD